MPRPADAHNLGSALAPVKRSNPDLFFLSISPLLSFASCLPLRLSVFTWLLALGVRVSVSYILSLTHLFSLSYERASPVSSVAHRGAHHLQPLPGISISLQTCTISSPLHSDQASAVMRPVFTDRYR